MALLILTSNEFVGVSSGTFTVVGTRDGKETVTVAPGAKVTLDASFNAGGDSITVSGNAGSYKAVADGTQVILTDALGGTVTIPVGTTKSTVVFADATRDLVISGPTGSQVLKLGNDTVTTTAATVTAGTGGTTPVVGQTFTLTTSTDALTGTSGDDKFNAVIQGAGDAGTTAQPGDLVTGGAGTDTLNISIAGALALDTPYTLSAVQAVDVEKVLVSNFDTKTGGTTEEINIIDTTLMSDLVTVGLSASSASGDTAFAGMKNFVAAEMRNGAADLTLTYDGAQVTTGTADSQVLTVSNNTGGTFTANGIESIAITSELVKSTVAAVASDAMKQLTVTGTADLKVTAALNFASNGTATAPGAVVDASAFKGKLTITTTAGEVLSIAGGSGDDTITVGSLTKDDAIAGGDGIDTLVMPSAGLTTEFAKVSSIETVVFAAGVAAQTLDASKLSTGVTTIRMDLSDGTDGDSTVATGTVSGLAGQTVVINHSVADAADADNSDGTGYVITNKLDTVADTVNVTLDSIGLNTAGAATYGVDSLTVANFETVNLNSKKSVTVTANELRSLTDTSATTLNITGDADLTLTQTGAVLTKVDASSLAAKLNLTLGANDVNVTGTAKDDTIAFAGNLNNKDVVDGGVGKDQLTASVSGLTATTGALRIANVESIVLTTGADNTLNLAGVTGATSLSVSGSTQTITGLDFGTKLVATADSVFKVTAAEASGANDVLTVERSLGTNADGTLTVAVSGVETLAVVLNDQENTASNTATYTLAAFTGNTVTVSQSASSKVAANVDLGLLNKSVTTVDTSAVKGTQAANASNSLTAVTFKLSGSAAATVTGSGVADTFNISSTGAVVHAITGGGGSDTTNIDVLAAWVDPSGIATKTVNVNVNPGDDISLATGTAFNAASTVISVKGGNSISTFSNIGQTNTYLADAVTAFNASAFGGNITVGVADDKLNSSVTITGGSLATDSVTSNYATAATYTPVIVGVETLKISAGNTTTSETFVLDLSSTTGVIKVEANNIGTVAADTFTVDKITTQTVVVVGSALTGNVFEAKLTDASGTADSVSFELKNAVGPAIVGTPVLNTANIETINLKASGADTTVSLANLSMTDATATEKLVVTGDKALTVSALNAAVTTIDASGMGTGGSFIQTGRSTTSEVSYTGSAGSDTFMMTNAKDAINGGAGTDSLVVSGSLILGGLLVDLSSTTDQVVSFNGNANTAIQIGFENVDLSGLSGNFGADITANKAGSVITGTINTDQITLGAGADVVVLGTAASDTITGFKHDVDTIQMGGTDTAVGILVGAGATNTTANAIVFDTAANLGANGVSIGNSSAAAEPVLYAVASDTGAIYYDADGNWTAGSIQVATIGVVTGLDAGDFTVA